MLGVTSIRCSSSYPLILQKTAFDKSKGVAQGKNAWKNGTLWTISESIQLILIHSQNYIEIHLLGSCDFHKIQIIMRAIIHATRMYIVIKLAPFALSKHLMWEVAWDAWPNHHLFITLQKHTLLQHKVVNLLRLVHSANYKHKDIFCFRTLECHIVYTKGTILYLMFLKYCY